MDQLLQDGNFGYFMSLFLKNVELHYGQTRGGVMVLWTMGPALSMRSCFNCSEQFLVVATVYHFNSSGLFHYN